MSDIRPYKIHVSNSKIERLKQKLSIFDLPHELPESDFPPWERGPPLTDIKRLAEYWRDGYDWRKHEARLNDAFPQYMTSIKLSGFLQLRHPLRPSTERGQERHSTAFRSWMARKLFGGYEDLALACQGRERRGCEWKRRRVFPCCGTEFGGFWVFESKPEGR